MAQNVILSHSQGVDVTETSSKPLIASRVLLLGEQIVAPEIMERLEDRHLQIFMREPDPELWPVEMEDLVQYLPLEERIGFDMAKILPRHEAVLGGPLREWALSVSEDIGQSADPQIVLDQMVEHIRKLLSTHLKEN
ncbi:MAG: hypothetical protein HY912_06970 [Desulfomonile tiedjei]|uniref:Uncharacterized protein n=1 Tax=Desulfomonile tiedjei TaxID=2358 RepID=A0A9D6V1W0_9BACT|nr:hypothetical protein [Desulfomonile tiedjei]